MDIESRHGTICYLALFKITERSGGLVVFGRKGRLVEEVVQTSSRRALQLRSYTVSTAISLQNAEEINVKVRQLCMLESIFQQMPNPFRRHSCSMMLYQQPYPVPGPL